MANIFGYIKESINEGEGLRSVIFISGCHGLCEECHNPESWDKNYGYPFSKNIQNNIINNLKSNPLIAGVTFCGGEPFLSPLPLLKFIHKAKNECSDLTYWSYTGFTFEQILKDENKTKLLNELDVLIDGPFVVSKRDLTLKWVGSSNQRIIDVQESLKQNKVVLYDV